MEVPVVFNVIEPVLSGILNTVYFRSLVLSGDPEIAIENTPV